MLTALDLRDQILDRLSCYTPNKEHISYQHPASLFPKYLAGVKEAEQEIFICLTLVFSCDIGVVLPLTRLIRFCLTASLIFLEKV
jgi:hypothetical protein